MIIQTVGPDNKYGGDIDPSTLPLSKETVSELEDWYKLWLKLTNDEGEILDIDMKLFDERGVKIWQKVQRELGDQYKVTYYSHKYNDTFASIQEYMEASKSG